MVVVFQPGGNIRDARVVLRFDEKVPNRFNTREAVVYRESEEDPREWLLVKPKNTVLEQDSPLLSQPELPEVDILSLTPPAVGDSFEHQDIIRVEEPSEDQS
jgi:hypothetical protein